jgi:hypothetical protein
MRAAAAARTERSRRDRFGDASVPMMPAGAVLDHHRRSISRQPVAEDAGITSAVPPPGTAR